uniref:Uncharacterized protein n=1 Tax=Trichogramma kaykai TaxID=54128 RepID=A0ABD2XEX4_9HYME
MMSGNENPADKAKQDALYEDREPKKIIRLITVTAYMVSVSFVGIVLSIYYVFLWHPPNPRLMHAQAQAEHHERLEGAIEYLRQELDHQRHSSSSSSAPLSIKLPADRGHTMTLADVQPLDLFYGERHRQENSSSKTRREILKNFNAILSANFDRTKSTSEATSTIMDSPGESGLSSDSSQSATVTKHNGVIVASEEESFTTAETTTITTPSTTMTTTTTSPATRETVTFPASMTTRSIKKTRLTAKKPHQTPFALKHLEVPIQSDSIKRRQGGSISTPSPTLFYSTQARYWTCAVESCAPNVAPIFYVASQQPQQSTSFYVSCKNDFNVVLMINKKISRNEMHESCVGYCV